MTVCARSAVRCQTNGCPHPAVAFCRYPVKRNGRTGQCNRHICSRCANAERLCPPHARIAPDTLVAICSRCFSQSCAAPDDDWQCDSPGPPRRVTVAEWKKLISFGLL